MTEALIFRLSQPTHQIPAKQFNRSGVYLLHDTKAVVYVGQSLNMWRRIGNHLYEGLKTFDGISCIPCPTDTMAHWEHFLIGVLLPKYNQCAHATELRRMIAEGCDEGAISAVIGRPPKRNLGEVAALLGLRPSDLRWRQRQPA